MPNVVQVVISGVDRWSGMLGKATKDFAAFKNVAATAALAVGAAIASATVAAAALTKESIDLADATGKAAQRAGVAVEDFSALAYAGKLADVSMQDLQVAAKGLSKHLAETGQTSTALLPKILELADEFERMPDGVNK